MLTLEESQTRCLCVRSKQVSAVICRYGAEQGKPQLREALCSRFYAHVGRKPNEIFVSDGSKCDIGRLQMMFGSDTTVAVQASSLRS